MKKILAGILALTACFSFVGCEEEKQTANNGLGNWGNIEDWEDYYDDILNDTLDNMYTTFTETDGKIDLPETGIYTYKKSGKGSVTKLEKVAYRGQAYNTSDYTSIEVTLYCEAITVEDGYAYLKLEWYDKDGYMIDSEITGQSSLTEGKKFTMTVNLLEDWSYEEYQQKGLRLEIVTVDE